MLFLLRKEGAARGSIAAFLRVRRVRGIALCGGCSVEGVYAVRESSACGIALCEGCSVGGVCAVRDEDAWRVRGA